MYAQYIGVLLHGIFKRILGQFDIDNISVYPSFIYPGSNPSVRLSVCLSVCLSVNVFLWLSVGLSVVSYADPVARVVFFAWPNRYVLLVAMSSSSLHRRHSFHIRDLTPVMLSSSRILARPQWAMLSNKLSHKV